jgi:large subunit ribosomal protein L24
VQTMEAPIHVSNVKKLKDEKPADKKADEKKADETGEDS